MNSLLKGSPEAGQLMKAIDFPVNLFTGRVGIDIPIYTMGGNGIAVPVSASYQSSGGISVDELASRIGLGFNLSAGGEITREVRGLPDEGGHNGNTTWLGLFYNLHTVEEYSNMTDNDHNNAMINVARGMLDLEPDMFYFSMPGHSGKFVFNDQTQGFETTTQQPYKITYNGEAAGWTVVADEGTRYYFNAKEMNANTSECVGMTAVNNFSTPVTTSWKLSKIVNADATDSITFQYFPATYTYYSSGSSIVYRPMGNSNARPNLNCFTKNRVTGATRLQKIETSTEIMSFQNSLEDRLDLPFGKALNRILVTTKTGELKKAVQFNYDYYSRTAFIGNVPDQGTNKYSLRLLSIADYGDDSTNMHPQVHSFGYNATNLPGRLSYAQDYWGFANNNSEPTTMAPRMILGPPDNLNLPGAVRTAAPAKALAGILESITYPTGGKTTFEYEGNDIGYNTDNIGSVPLVGQGMGLVDVKEYPAELLNALYDTTFEINVGGGPQGGVIASINVMPNTQWWGYNNLQRPEFYLARTDNDGRPSPGGVFTDNVSNRFFPNGHYLMQVRPKDMRDPFNSIPQPRSFFFSVGWSVPDSTQHNFDIGGLRIKKITSTDNVTGIPVIKEYLYHNPLNDSSYGKMIGKANTSYKEYSTVDNKIWLVRNGNVVIPGWNPGGSPVVYPVVTEQQYNGSEVHRTQYTFSNMTPLFALFWPFTPPLDLESRRGNPTSTTSFLQFGSSNFITSAKTVNTYADNPVINGNESDKQIMGIKAVFDSYSNGQITQGNALGFLPPRTSAYSTGISRTELLSTTVTRVPDNGPVQSQTTQFINGIYNRKPVQTTMTNSNGEVLTTNTWYPSDSPGPEPEINPATSGALNAQNRVGVPMGTRQYQGSKLISSQFSYGQVNGQQFLIDSFRSATYSNPLDRELKALSYDSYGNPISVQLRGNKYQRNLWYGKEDRQLASCVMAQDGAFVFTSFEYADEYNWDIAGRTTADAFSGSYAYSLAGRTLTFSGFNSSSGLEVYAWASGGGFSANGNAAVATGRTRGGWSLYMVRLASTAAVTISGNVQIDQLVIVPAASNVTGNVYDSRGRVIAEVDQNLSTTFVQYDGYNRPLILKDEQGNILKQYSYQYQGAQ